MVRLICTMLMVMVLLPVNSVFASSLHEPFSALLEKYVQNGVVDYEGLKQERRVLDNYLKKLSTVTLATFDNWSKPDRLAYLINLYNAVTLQLTINTYPVNSLKDVETNFTSPWKRKVVRLFGSVINLETLERKFIAREYHEPRIHLALVCASKSSPPLRSEAYDGTELHNQLEDQGKKFFASSKGIQIDHERKKVYLNQTIKWNESDFISVESFVEKYTNTNIDGYDIAWLEYDWGLNKME